MMNVIINSEKKSLSLHTRTYSNVNCCFKQVLPFFVDNPKATLRILPKFFKIKTAVAMAAI